MTIIEQWNFLKIIIYGSTGLGTRASRVSKLIARRLREHGNVDVAAPPTPINCTDEMQDWKTNNTSRNLLKYEQK